MNAAHGRATRATKDTQQVASGTTRRRLSIPNPVSSAREVLAIVRELSLEELRDEALRLPRIAVIARTVDEAREQAERIFGPQARQHVVAQGEDEPWPPRADVVLVERGSRPRRLAGGEAVVEFSAADPVEPLRQTLLRARDDIELPLGRTFPVFRQAAALYVVNTTARVNGQFALVSNIPALVPVVGGVLAAGADTIVLTKNQLMMLYKLAAIHGRDVNNRFRIYQEMIPVVGAGLVWRTVARELAAMLPFAAGTVPKVAIAVAGTYAVGMGAHLYYVEGRPVSGSRARELYRQALDELGRFQRGATPAAGAAGVGEDDRYVIDVDYRSGSSAGMP